MGIDRVEEILRGIKNKLKRKEEWRILEEGVQLGILKFPILKQLTKTIFIYYESKNNGSQLKHYINVIVELLAETWSQG